MVPRFSQLRYSSLDCLHWHIYSSLGIIITLWFCIILVTVVSSKILLGCLFILSSCSSLILGFLFPLSFLLQFSYLLLIHLIKNWTHFVLQRKIVFLRLFRMIHNNWQTIQCPYFDFGLRIISITWYLFKNFQSRNVNNLSWRTILINMMN